MIAASIARIIAIEEHVWSPRLREALIDLDSDQTVTAFSNSPHANALLLDVDEGRLARMDAMGIDVQVLSITAPGTQHLPADVAVTLARDANDFLADAVRRHPARFAAFATLPTPDPEAAAVELRRCIEELGFVGAMLFPRTGPDFLDHSRYRPIFAAAASLDVPLYIHPSLPPESVRRACYAGLGASTDLMLATGGWGWHAEAGLAALRLILARTFDRHPGLQLILGHMGEMLVSFVDRADALTRVADIERSVLDCISNNFYATPGGVFSHRMLSQVIDVLGPDRIMFAADDPYSGTLGAAGGRLAREFIESARISPEDREKLAYRNAERLLFRSTEQMG